MDPNFFMGGGAEQTRIHPVILAALVIATILILLLPRKYVILPLFLTIFLSPVGQELYVSGAHFYVPRLLILVGWLRVVCSRLSPESEFKVGEFNAVDKVFALWAFFRATAIIFLFGFSQAIVNQAGSLLDVIGGYFLLRILIRDKEDVIRTIKVFATICVVISVCMLNEKFRNQNVFGYLGGIGVTPLFRDGAVRAQGPFEHPILAGTFAATLVPLFVSLWMIGETKFAAIAGAAGATAIVLTSASSTPLLAFITAIAGICFWPIRKQMRPIRWAIVILLVSLHLVMKAPVWMLIARVDLVGGSSGYHRAALIDMFIRHIGDWWLIGTHDMAKWGYEMGDVGNQFVAEGESGGLATFICFIAFISMSFSRLGRARKTVEGDAKQEWLFWLLGVALLSHVVAYFGISYFDQTGYAWKALLVMITAVTAPVLAGKTVPGNVTDSRPARPRLGLSPLPSLGSARVALRK